MNDLIFIMEEHRMLQTIAGQLRQDLSLLDRIMYTRKYRLYLAAVADVIERKTQIERIAEASFPTSLYVTLSQLITV